MQTQTFATQLDSNTFTRNFQIVLQQFTEKRPDSEQLQAAFIEHLAVIDSIGILARSTDMDMSSAKPVDILAIFLVGFLKGVYCMQAETNVPKVDPSGCLRAWHSLQGLAKYYDL
jgi:hypothetical protein